MATLDSKALTFAQQTIITLAIAMGCGCNTTDRKLSFSAHSKSSIPATAQLLHSGGQYAGLDASYGFVFSVTDDAILDQLVAEWKLTRYDSPSESGFFKFANHPWWPNAAEFSAMDPSYGRQDTEGEEYWIVWPDSKSGKLYVEHGRW